MSKCATCRYWDYKSTFGWRLYSSPEYGYCKGQGVFFLEEDEDDEDVPQEPRIDGIGIIGDWPKTGRDFGCVHWAALLDAARDEGMSEMKTKMLSLYEVHVFPKDDNKPTAIYHVAAADINTAVRLFKEHYTQYDVHLGSIQFVGYVLTEE